MNFHSVPKNDEISLFLKYKTMKKHFDKKFQQCKNLNWFRLNSKKVFDRFCELCTVLIKWLKIYKSWSLHRYLKKNSILMKCESNQFKFRTKKNQMTKVSKKLLCIFIIWLCRRMSARADTWHLDTYFCPVHNT